MLPRPSTRYGVDHGTPLVSKLPGSRQPPVKWQSVEQGTGRPIPLHIQPERARASSTRSRTHPGWKYWAKKGPQQRHGCGMYCTHAHMWCAIACRHRTCCRLDTETTPSMTAVHDRHYLSTTTAHPCYFYLPSCLPPSLFASKLRIQSSGPVH